MKEVRLLEAEIVTF
jgi:hypothetical protein